MEQLDSIDSKILYELGKDARLSYKQLSKKINSKKEVVAYRIKNLIDKKIITKFVPVFSLSNLGISSGKIYISLKGLTGQKEEELKSKLVKNPNITWIAESVGRWDLLIGFYFKDILEFGKLKTEILSEVSEFIQDYDITFIEDGIVLNREYLVKNNSSRKEFIFGGERKYLKLDELDKKILPLIRNDGRFEYVELAKKLNLDARTILSRINNLKSSGVLQGFTVFIDLDKLGKKLHKICISLYNPEVSSVRKVVSALKENLEVIHVIKSIGSWELEAEIESEDIENIFSYTRKLKNELKDIIKKIELVSINKELKLEFLPSNEFFEANK